MHFETEILTNVVEVEHLSYPCENLWINYAYIKSDQINRTRTANYLN